jgi:beta-glucosidase/6-phospho-beta-glucosidase/beta-galactosidase
LIQFNRAVPAWRTKGESAWGLMVHFEWTDAYGQRYGLIYVDHSNQKRTVKDSWHLYGKIAGTSRPGRLTAQLARTGILICRSNK